VVRAGVDAAQALADLATIAILQHCAALEAQRLIEQLQYALNSRVAIEQAKGMISERDGSDMDQAFITLRNHARNHNVRLRQLAPDLMSGALSVSALDRT
jgi:AmiR/NasT family two-component response regulator